MARTRMGMPVSLEIADAQATSEDFDVVFAYFESVDERFSPYRDTSEVAALNRGVAEPSAAMRDVLELAERTRRETGGYFNIVRPDGRIDPSGIVKGWAIQEAARCLQARGVRNFVIDIGGDVASAGVSTAGTPWRIGIRNPFVQDEIVKVLEPRGQGVATSGTYLRGPHIYNPHAAAAAPDDLVSLTVIGPDILEADRFATAAFAMGRAGLDFLEAQPGLEAYGIAPSGIATYTSGFMRSVAQAL